MLGDARAARSPEFFARLRPSKIGNFPHQEAILYLFVGFELQMIGDLVG
jgi:hypothetical protein